MTPLSVVAVLCGFVLPLALATTRPIIGVLTQPSSSSISQFGQQFIAASYIKYVEGAGARAAPILYTQSATELTELFKGINGILFPGGGVDFGSEPTYMQTINSLYKMAMQANSQGDYFPVWGTCMGFQEVCMLTSGNWSLLSPYNSENYTVPLTLTGDALKSRFLGGAPDDVVQILKTENVTMNNHMWGVSPSSFQSSGLSSFFHVLSTNVDRDGKEFISTIEGINHPIYASQWHPEKPIYEWNIHEVINHSSDSVLANQYAANFLVNEARKNNHAFPSAQAETKALIYSYSAPVYIYNYVNDFEQGYFFNSTSL